MEGDCYDPSQVTSIIFMNKKRKLQVEQLGLPQPKHNCCRQGIASELGLPSIEIPETEDVCAVLVTGIIHGEERDSESELESGNSSNSFAEDDDSIMSVSDGAKSDSLYLKMCSVDCPSTPVNQGGDCDNGTMFSLDSRVTKSSADKGKSPCTDYDYAHRGSLASLNDEDFSEYEDNEKYVCLDYVDDSIEQYKKLGLLYSSGSNSENLVNGQENQQAAEKPTIDKEFEEYFSNLML